MGSATASQIPGYPSMDSPSSRAAAAASSNYSQSSLVPGANHSQISSSAATMRQPMLHSTPAPQLPRYPARPGFQTPTRGALSAMLSNSSTPTSGNLSCQRWHFLCVMPSLV